MMNKHVRFASACLCETAADPSALCDSPGSAAFSSTRHKPGATPASSASQSNGLKRKHDRDWTSSLIPHRPSHSLPPSATVSSPKASHGRHPPQQHSQLESLPVEILQHIFVLGRNLHLRCASRSLHSSLSSQTLLTSMEQASRVRAFNFPLRSSGGRFDLQERGAALETAEWDVPLTRPQMARLCRGHVPPPSGPASVPGSMAATWFVYVDGPDPTSGAATMHVFWRDDGRKASELRMSFDPAKFMQVGLPTSAHEREPAGRITGLRYLSWPATASSGGGSFGAGGGGGGVFPGGPPLLPLATATSTSTNNNNNNNNVVMVDEEAPLRLEAEAKALHLDICEALFDVELPVGRSPSSPSMASWIRQARSGGVDYSYRQDDEEAEAVVVLKRSKSHL